MSDRARLAGAELLAHVLISKYADNLPLYRRAQIYAREGVEIEPSTMTQWVAGCFRLLAPLVEALARNVMSTGKLHATIRRRRCLTLGAPRPACCARHGVCIVESHRTKQSLMRVRETFTIIITAPTSLSGVSMTGCLRTVSLDCRPLRGKPCRDALSPPVD